MKPLRMLALFSLYALSPQYPLSPLFAQDVRARLESRGLPADLVDQVAAIAADATAQGLPSAPLADKAIEGFAKQIPGARIVAVVRQYGARMLDARSAVRDAGVAEPAGPLISAATDAMGRGFAAAEIGRLVRAAPQSEIATPGLTVAAALVAQGITTQVAADVVAQAMQGGSSAAQILDLPSAARAMQSRGMSPEDAGRELLRGGRGGREAGAPPVGNRGPGGLDGRPGPGPDGRGGPGTGPTPPRPGGTRPPAPRPGDGGRPPRP